MRLWRSKGARRCMRLMLGLLIGALLAEAGLRIAGLAPPSPYEPDLICGARLKANYAGWHRTEGQVYFRTNSAGFRDREHTLEKPSGVLRIAVLGDSYCEALQVELEQTFWHVLEERLNAGSPVPGHAFEVLNTGVSGYGTAQELLTLRSRLWDYQPDIVLLAFLTGNDLHNNVRELEGDSLRPYFVLDRGELILDNSFLQAPYFTSRWIGAKDWMIQSSRLLTLLYRIKHRAAAPSSGEAGLDDFIYREPEAPLHRAAWAVTERLIQELESEVAAQGAELVVATLTNGIQVHPERRVREMWKSKLEVPDLTYPDRRIQQFALGIGCVSVKLVDAMAEHAASRQAFLHGFANTRLGEGHWNVDGHRVAGEELARQLLANRELWERLRGEAPKPNPHPQ